MDPILGSVMLCPYTFAPQGWMFCNGQTLTIQTNAALYALIGIQFGGNGQTTFNLPDLRGRLPIHQGQGAGLSARTLGEPGGVEQVTLNQGQLPPHNHTALANSGIGTVDSPYTSYWAGSANTPQFAPGSQANTTMSADTIGFTGGNQPHSNLQPYLAVSFIIALEGIFPTQG